jgi:hypothetical protein
MLTSDLPQASRETLILRPDRSWLLTLRRAVLSDDAARAAL